MIKILLSLTLLSLLLVAEEPLPDDLKLSLGTYIVADHKTDLIVKNGGTALSLDMQEIFSMKTKTASIYFGGYYRFTDHHRMEVEYQGISSSGKSSGGKDFNPNFPINLTGEVSSSLDIKILKILYTYSFYHKDEVELAVSIGLHRTAIDYDLGASIGESATNFSIAIAPPIPVIGVRFAYDIYPEWNVLFYYDFITLVADLNLPDMPEVTGMSGFLTDATLATEYRFFDNLSAGLALNVNRINFIFKRTDVDVGIENDVVGGTVYASFRY